MSEQYGPDERFASERAHQNFNIAVLALMALTGSDQFTAGRAVNAIAAFIMRDYADRAKLT